VALKSQFSSCLPHAANLGTGGPEYDGREGLVVDRLWHRSAAAAVVTVLLLGDEIARLYKEPTNVTYLALSVFEGLLKLNQPVTCLCYERHQRQI
jgi:hypothetical protein